MRNEGAVSCREEGKRRGGKRRERGGVESRVCMIGGRDTKKKYYLLSVALVFLSYFRCLFQNLCALKSIIPIRYSVCFHPKKVILLIELGKPLSVFCLSLPAAQSRPPQEKKEEEEKRGQDPSSNDL